MCIRDSLKPIPLEERSDLVGAYHRRLTSEDKKTRLQAARAWAIWEASTSKLIPASKSIRRFGEDSFAEAFARIECHYFVNKGFLETEDQLLVNCDRISHIPGVIVQGRYDVVCPMVTSWELHKAWAIAEYKVIADAGHSVSEPGIVDALVIATDYFAD